MFSPLILHRVGHWLYLRGLRKLPELIRRINYGFTGCDLGAGLRVGRNVHFQHFGSGVVLHSAVTIEDDVWIMPQVVLGQNLRGHGEVPGVIHITVRRAAMLGTGCKVIASGRLEIGEGASIGANAVVLRSVPANMLAVGVPAHVIEKQPMADAATASAEATTAATATAAAHGAAATNEPVAS